MAWLVIVQLVVTYGIVLCAGLRVHASESSETDDVSQESRLISWLLARYKVAGKIARPVRNSSATVHVQFGIRLVHLDLDAKEQIMTTSVWTRMLWYDENLKWEPSKFGDITTVIIPIRKIWSPDIVLVNTAVTTVTEQPADAVIKFIGQVLWAPQRKYSSACLIDVTEYPYDRHTCDMWFQCMANPSEMVNITLYERGDPLDLDTYLSSYRYAQEWEIINNTAAWHKRSRDIGIVLMWSRRASIKFTLIVQRRAGFTGMILIVPCALLSFLVPLVFCFPPERPDRHTLAMSLFASLTVLLFMVNEVAPPSASFVPRLALYYCFNLLVLLLTTCCSAVVVNLSKRGETREKVPKAVRMIFIKALGHALCFGPRLKHLTEVRRASKRNKERYQEASGSEPTAQSDSRNGTTPFQPSVVPQSYPAQGGVFAPSSSSDTTDYQLLVQISRKLNRMESRLEDRKSTRREDVPDISVPLDVQVEWRTLAMVLDRLFFFLFLALVIISLGVFYPRTTE